MKKIKTDKSERMSLSTIIVGDVNMFLSGIDRLSKQKINNDIKDLNIN
jgi:uncharacterized protein (UPF0335 family)